LIAALDLNHPLGTTYSTLVKGLIALIQGNPDQVAEQLRSFDQSQFHGINRYWVNLVRAMTHVSNADWDSVQKPLEHVIDYAITVQGIGVMAWCLPIYILIAAHEGQFEQAASLLALSDSLGLALWAERWRPFNDVQGLLENTLSAAAYERAIEAGYKLDVAKTLEGLAHSAHQRNSHRFPTAVIRANQALEEPLSERELEVLGSIAQGLQNAEIAELLVVEMSTIKKHVGHVYGKLGVTTRAQAIVKAQQLGLV
jgi:ATP/maltotriose-dependent transcriptional regulator MalT